MKLLKFTYLLVILTSFTFISCENEPLTGTFTDETGAGGSGSGSGGGAGSGTSTGDYFPRAIGNTWDYSVTGSGSNTNIISSTDIINGVTYYRFEGENGFGAIRKSAASYFSRIGVNLNTPAYVITGTPIEIKFLQDDAPVGTSWENPVSTTYTYTPVGGSPAIPNTTVNMNYKYTVEEVGISHTVNGVTYDNVIHLSHILETGLGTPDTVGEYYFSKDVGPIEYAIDGESYKLTSYSLN